MQVGEQGGMLEIVYIDRRIGWIEILGILSILLSDLNYPDPCSHTTIYHIHIIKVLVLRMSIN